MDGPRRGELARTAVSGATTDRTGVAAPSTPPVAPLELRPLLEMWGVTMRWPRVERPVLDGVDLLLERGTLTWLGGRNGTGKTTLLRIAAGMLLPARGVVILDELHPVRDRRAYQGRVGFLSAGNAGLHARLTVRRHLRYWARLAFIPAAERPAAIERVLGLFDLEELAGRRVDRMSMGQRQRVRLAGTFLHDPDVILLDEPRNSLDSEGVEIVVAAVQAVMDRGGAAVWCAPTGEQQPIDPDQGFLLEDGRLVEA